MMVLFRRIASEPDRHLKLWWLAVDDQAGRALRREGLSLCAYANAS